MICTVKGFGVVNEAEVDGFLEFPCFLHDPMDADNLISGSSALSKPRLYGGKLLVHVMLKPSLYIWTFLVHVLLKSILKDFEHVK